MSDQLVKHTIEIWETVAVTALPPGWRNVYTHDDGGISIEDCPAILLQENRITEHCRDKVGADGQIYLESDLARHEPPYETRAVYATSQDDGWLTPVDEIGNYATTIGPNGNPAAYGRPATPKTADPA